MYASITADMYSVFYGRVYATPTFQSDSYAVYKLCGFDDWINIRLNGCPVGRVNHLAIDANGNLHTFDPSGKLRARNLGPCKFFPDETHDIQ